jgi:serine/threonine protein kinase
VSEATSYEDYHLVNVGLLPDNFDKVKAYQKNQVKLVLSLLTIMGKCHTENILHNDLLPSNIMLHFPLKKPENMYIGVCDWSMANCFEEEKSLLYGYQTKAEMEANIAERKHVAPELFYVFRPKGSWNSLDVMKKKHLYSKAADAYSVGILASQIWREEWDRELLPDKMIFHSLELKLKGLKDKDPETRLSISDVLTRFKTDPFKFEMPKCRFHKEI